MLNEYVPHMLHLNEMAQADIRGHDLELQVTILQNSASLADILKNVYYLYKMNIYFGVNLKDCE